MLIVYRKLTIVMACLLFAVWALVSRSYYGPTTPLTDSEITTYLSALESLLVETGVPAGDGSVALAENLKEFRQFAERDDGKPFYMINLMRWREQAVFRDHIDGVEGLTPEDADRLYNEKLFYELANNASHTAYLSSAEPNAMNYGVGLEADNWDEVGIFRYRSRRDFFDMVVSDRYAQTLYFKLASMGSIALVPTQPHGLVLNPVPNIPVLLGLVFVIVFLIILLIQAHRR